MSYDQDRLAGIKIANELGAVKTARLIERSTSNFEVIFHSAIAELGMDAVASALVNAPPVWAHMALLHIPGLGAHSAALAARAADASDGSVTPGSTTTAAVETVQPVRAAAAAAAVMGGPLSIMTLNNHMAADCQWTAKWMDGGEEQPTKNYPNWNNWKWSGTLTAGCGSTISLNTFASSVPNSPLNTGDVVWIYVWVAGGSDRSGRTDLTSYQFTYDSGSPSAAVFGISGTTTINTLSVEKYPV